MTPAEWRELKAAQRVLEHPDRHSHAILEEATDRFTVLSAKAFAEVGETMRQLGAHLQTRLDAALPAVRRFVAVCVEAGILEAPQEEEATP